MNRFILTTTVLPDDVGKNSILLTFTAFFAFEHLQERRFSKINKSMHGYFLSLPAKKHPQ